MKAILEFELPDDELQLKLATLGPEMYAVLVDIDILLRNHVKHGNDAHSTEVINRARGMMSEVMARLE